MTTLGGTAEWGCSRPGKPLGRRSTRVVDAVYERRSIAVTSNLHPSGFDTIMPKTLATATVHRLLHHAHVVLTEGTSLRLLETIGTRHIELATRLVVRDSTARPAS